MGYRKNTTTLLRQVTQAHAISVKVSKVTARNRSTIANRDGLYDVYIVRVRCVSYLTYMHVEGSTSSIIQIECKSVSRKPIVSNVFSVFGALHRIQAMDVMNVLAAWPLVWWPRSHTNASFLFIESLTLLLSTCIPSVVLLVVCCKNALVYFVSQALKTYLNSIDLSAHQVSARCLLRPVMHK